MNGDHVVLELVPWDPKSHNVKQIRRKRVYVDRNIFLMEILADREPEFPLTISTDEMLDMIFNQKPFPQAMTLTVVKEEYNSILTEIMDKENPQRKLERDLSEN